MRGHIAGDLPRGEGRLDTIACSDAIACSAASGGTLGPGGWQRSWIGCGFRLPIRAAGRIDWIKRKIRRRPCIWQSGLLEVVREMLGSVATGSGIHTGTVGTRAAEMVWPKLFGVEVFKADFDSRLSPEASWQPCSIQQPRSSQKFRPRELTKWIAIHKSPKSFSVKMLPTEKLHWQHPARYSYWPASSWKP